MIKAFRKLIGSREEQAHPEYKGIGVAPETLILAADAEWVQASDLKVGQPLLGFTAEPPPGHVNRLFEMATVTAVSVEETRYATRLCLHREADLKLEPEEWHTEELVVADPLQWLAIEVGRTEPRWEGTRNLSSFGYNLVRVALALGQSGLNKDVYGPGGLLLGPQTSWDLGQPRVGYRYGVEGKTIVRFVSSNGTCLLNGFAVWNQE